METQNWNIWIMVVSVSIIWMVKSHMIGQTIQITKDLVHYLDVTWLAYQLMSNRKYLRTLYSCLFFSDLASFPKAGTTPNTTGMHWDSRVSIFRD